MFEKIKENWQKRIEKNTFKSEMYYKDKKGKLHTEWVFIKRSLLPLGDWARVYPPIKENGKLHLINLIFGGRRNLIKLIFILIIVAAVLIQFKENFNVIESLREQCMPYLENLM